MKWDKHKKPPEDICPKNFCFLWSELENKCRKSFGKCRRSTVNLNDKDLYEPCEPELEKNGLPWFYFIVSVETLVEENKAEYLIESQKLWKL